MLDSINLAIRDVFAPPFRTVLYKSIGLTLLMVVALYIAVIKLVELPWPYAQTALDFILGVGLVFGTGYFLAPVTAVFAGFFLDDIAEVTEKTRYPLEKPGIPVSIRQAIVSALKFTGVVIVANSVMLLLLLVPGVNIVIFFLGNGYLIGREYFEVAAGRFHDPVHVALLRRRHGTRLFLDGLVITLVLVIPIVNLLTPLFATALMVHEHKKLMKLEG